MDTIAKSLVLAVQYIADRNYGQCEDDDVRQLESLAAMLSGATESERRAGSVVRIEGLSGTGVRRSGSKRIYRVCGADLCLGLHHCDKALSRPRKSCVPQSRPFKETESRPRTVPFRGWLALRAASTS